MKHEPDSSFSPAEPMLVPLDQPAAGSHCPGPAPGPLDTAIARTAKLRHDGWTPERKRDFLSRLAEGWTVVDACFSVGMSAQGAYNLRNRDRLFATGWDAACLMARQPVADEVYSRSMHGVVEKVVRDGAVVAERHRYDNRLTMAVLTRLDRRADAPPAPDRACDAAVANWAAFLDCVGKGHMAEAESLTFGEAEVEAERYAQLHQLRAMEYDREDPHNLWEEDGVFWTNYPAPPGFEGVHEGRYGDPHYRRSLSPDEQSIVDREITLDKPCAQRGEQQRAAFFEGLRNGVGPADWIE
jgi:hypothetical protein